MNARGFFGGLACGLLLTISAATAAARPPATILDGQWKGALAVPGGQLSVVFRLMRLTGGDFFATLDVPQQKLSHVDVQVSLRGDTVVLAAPQTASRFTGRLAPDGQRLSGQWQQPGFAVALVLDRLAAPTVAETSPALSVPYRQENVRFNNPLAANELAGQLALPPGAGPFPAVVLLADEGTANYSPGRQTFQPLSALADYLVRRGVAVLRCDAQPDGTSAPPNPTLPGRVVDAEAALSYLRTRPEVDVAHIGLLGHGEGGNVALLAATSALPPSFAIVLGASGQPGPEMLLNRLAARLREAGQSPAQVAAALKRRRAMYTVIKQSALKQQSRNTVARMLQEDDPGLSPAAAVAQADELMSARHLFLLSYNPLTHLGAVRCPLLLLHGSADALTEADLNFGALQHGLQGNKTVASKKLPGVNHLFQAPPAEWSIVAGERKPTFSPQAQEMIRAWLVSLP